MMQKISTEAKEERRKALAFVGEKTIKAFATQDSEEILKASSYTRHEISKVSDETKQKISKVSDETKQKISKVSTETKLKREKERILAMAVTKKELELISRGPTFPVLITGINTILFIVGLVAIFSVIADMRQTLRPDYRSFLYIHAMMALCVFVIVLCIAPIFGAGAISGERQSKTFDLLFSTSLTPVNIVMEKMLSSFIIMSVITISFIPALCMPLIFGGVSFLEVFILFLSFLSGIFLILSVSMFAGSLAHTASRGIAIAYGFCALFIIGPLIIPMLTGRFAVSGSNQIAYILLVDPLYTLAVVSGNEIGETDLSMRIMEFLNFTPEETFFKFSGFISVIVQISVGLGFLLITIMNIMPGGILPKAVPGED